MRSALCVRCLLPSAPCQPWFEKGSAPWGGVISDPLRLTALRSPGLSAEDHPDQRGRFVEGMFTSDVVTYGKTITNFFRCQDTVTILLANWHLRSKFLSRRFLFPGPAYASDASKST